MLRLGDGFVSEYVNGTSDQLHEGYKGAMIVLLKKLDHT